MHNEPPIGGSSPGRPRVEVSLAEPLSSRATKQLSDNKSPLGCINRFAWIQYKNESRYIREGFISTNAVLLLINSTSTSCILIGGVQFGSFYLFDL